MAQVVSDPKCPSTPAPPKTQETAPAPAPTNNLNEVTGPSIAGTRTNMMGDIQVGVKRVQTSAAEVVKLLAEVGKHIEGWAGTNEINIQMGRNNPAMQRMIASSLTTELTKAFGPRADVEINGLLRSLKELEKATAQFGREGFERALSGSPEILAALKTLKSLKDAESMLKLVKNPFGSLLEKVSPELGRALGPIGELLPLNSWCAKKDGFHLKVSYDTTDILVGALGKQNPVSALLLNGRMASEGLIGTHGLLKVQVGPGMLSLNPGLSTDRHHNLQLSIGATWGFKF